MILETRRLILRNFIRADVDHYAAVCASSEVLPTPEERARGYIAAAACDPRLDYRMAVLDRRDGALVGSAGIRLHATGAATALLDCEMAQAHRQQGFGFEAAEAVLDMAFRQLDLEYVSGRPDATGSDASDAAMKLLWRLGMRPVSGTDGSGVMVVSRRDWLQAAS